MECTICAKEVESSGACRRCESKIRTQLSELPELHREAGQYLMPARTGSGSASQERSIGINVSALDFSMAIELLRTLHSWESQIRQDRNLTPPALVVKEKSTEAEVKATTQFHLAHLQWSLEQTWALDFANEVNTIHAKGRAAAKRFSEQPRRIPCPSDDCKKFVVVDAENLTAEVTCFGCKQTWTVLRLVALAMSNPKKIFYLDVEAIALWLGINEREVYRTIKKNEIDKRGNLYNLAAIIKARTI
jgi:hypothetical protein